MTETNKSSYCEPQEAIIVKNMLHQAGFVDYDPIVINQLLYIMYDYITAVVEDAITFSKHANKSELDKKDICLALQMKRNKYFISKNKIKKLTDKINSVVLPPIRFRDGLRLPPEDHCLTKTNYKLISTQNENDNVCEGVPVITQYKMPQPIYNQFTVPYETMMRHENPHLKRKHKNTCEF